MNDPRVDDEAVGTWGTRVLLINTSGAEGVVAVAEGGRVLATETLPGRGTSESLVPAVRRLMGEWRVSELAAVGVVVGPGSFTGTRAGLSAAKGLCEAGGVGMVATSRLALVAGEKGLAFLDAGRGEYYFGLYWKGVKEMEGLVHGGSVMEVMPGGRTATCEARVAEALRIRLVPEPGAEEMLAMVERRMRAGEWSDVAATDANYLRRTDAELKVLGG